MLPPSESSSDHLADSPSRWKLSRLFGPRHPPREDVRLPIWSLGVLNDKETVEVPGESPIAPMETPPLPP